jgi:flavorubredoxin
MINIQPITNDITWIGASDRRISRFENLFPLTNGVSYNSYLLKDEKTVLFDTADLTVARQFMDNLEAAMEGRKLDYLVVLHMEPDHCALISAVAERYPDLTIVASMKALQFVDQFHPSLKNIARMTVKEGSVLETGSHKISFVAAPMVHWPEVLFAYDDVSGALFSADAFGTWGAVDGSVFMDQHDFDKEYLDDARRYYANIVGKYGPQVQAVLKKAAKVDIKMLLPLHGPVWREDIGRFLDLYQKWSTYTPETDDIMIVYGTLYGNTGSAAMAASARIREKTGKAVHVFDVSETDVSYLIDAVWRCGRIVLFCPTYNNGLYPKMETFLHDLTALGVQNRTFALAENGTWAPVTAKLMRAELENLKKCTVLDTVLTIKSTLTDEAALEAFVDAIAQA